MSPVHDAAKACPVCGKPGAGAHAPFCGNRCADIDLGRWLKGAYAIPGGSDGEPVKPDQGGPGRDEASDD